MEARALRKAPACNQLRIASTPAELAALLKESYDRWGPIVKQIGFTADS